MWSISPWPVPDRYYSTTVKKESMVSYIQNALFNSKPTIPLEWKFVRSVLLPTDIIISRIKLGLCQEDITFEVLFFHQMQQFVILSRVTTYKSAIQSIGNQHPAGSRVMIPPLCQHGLLALCVIGELLLDFVPYQGGHIKVVAQTIPLHHLFQHTTQVGNCQGSL